MTAYDMRISDWSSDFCSSDLPLNPFALSLSKRRSFFCDAPKKNGASTSSARTDVGVSFRAPSPSPTPARPYIPDSPFRRARRAVREALRDRRSFLRRRSEEHTSELQSLMRISYAVFCLKKKTSEPKILKTTIDKHDKGSTREVLV